MAAAGRPAPARAGAPLPAPPLLRPRWPAPANVVAFATTRLGGCSAPPFDSLNLSAAVGDAAPALARNRALLAASAPALGRWQFLRQVHGAGVCRAPVAGPEPAADAVHSSTAGIACAVTTADCLPILICDEAGSEVLAIHAGWRGLAAGVIGAGVAAMHAPRERLMAWLGPRIGPTAYEVGAEVRAAWLAADPGNARFLEPARGGRWRADLAGAAAAALAGAGVGRCLDSGYCTYSQPALFFSHRRDGRTGRQVAVIGLAAP